MSKIKEILFLKEVNGVEEWFEDGNEETDPVRKQFIKSPEVAGRC